jgi:preprotein translocase subunit YajC
MSDGGPTPVHTSHMVLTTVLAAGSTGGKSGGGSSLSILVLVAIFALAYFLFLRPARNRQRAAATAKKKVEVGDEVTTTAGLIATVIAVDDDMLTLEVAPGVHCRYLPAAVLRVNTLAEDEPDADSPDASTHEVIDDPAVSPGTTESADDLPDEPTPA